MIYYDEPLYRPPSEAYSVIIQVTLGCSFNKCAFCTMYETKEYKQRPLDEVFSDIDTMARYNSDTTKLFLADGDALNVSTETLIEILKYAYSKFPKLRRVSTYASAFNLHDKSLEELKLLRENGLTLVYYGIESGSYEVLKKIQKPISQKKMIDSLNKASEAGMKISATVILGIGGKKYSDEHIRETVKIINSVNVNYLSTLQLMLEEHTFKKINKNFGGDFEILNNKEIIEEQKNFLTNLKPTNKIIFRSNHASNILPLAGNLPKNRDTMLSQIDSVLKNYF